MNFLTRRDPLEITGVNRLLNHFFNEPFLTGSNGVIPTIEEGALALDVSEDEKSVYVRASVPGYRREDVDVELHEGVLTIKAERNEETGNKNERFYRKERRFGSVMRRLALPSTVREEGIKAELKDGVLTVTLLKEEKEQPRKIKIG